MKVEVINSDTKDVIKEIEIDDAEKEQSVFLEENQTIQIIDDDGNILDQRSCSEISNYIVIKKWKFTNDYILDWDRVETAEEFFKILKTPPFRWEVKISLIDEDWDKIPDDVKKFFYRKHN